MVEGQAARDKIEQDIENGRRRAVEEPITDGSASVSVCDRDFCVGRPLVRIWEGKWEWEKDS
jgi:hypothetical protein